MKKMYNNPTTNTVRLDSDAIMDLGVSTSPVLDGGVFDAPARKGNPLQGQINK